MGGSTLEEAQRYPSDDGDTQVSPGERAVDFQPHPFRSLSVDKMLAGGTKIVWSLAPSFDEPTPWKFEVQWAASGSDAWESVTTVNDTFQATDTEERDYTVLFEGFYRVVLTDGDGNTYYSRPTNFPTSWDNKDLRYLEEMKRKIDLWFDKKVGVDCWVLHRKHWGAQCSACVDDTTGEVQNPQCDTCYGTGYEGGFFPALPYKCRLATSQTSVNQNVGTQINKQLSVQLMAFPPVCQHDVLVIDGFDERYRVKEVKPLANFYNRVLLQGLGLVAVDPDSVIYDFPLSEGNW